MFTRAIVESVVDNQHIKIRIPLLDRVSSSSIHTKSDDLNTATVCTLSNCHPNIRPGDVVFVTFEETDTSKDAVIVGYLYRDKETETYCDLILNNLEVKSKCTFPLDTSIGEVTGKELAMLSGINGNIQKQIQQLWDKFDLLESQLTSKVPSEGGES